jgi:hypothetical protein
VSLGKKIWIGLAVMAALTPAGLLLPMLFNAGESWGEWSPGSLAERIGFVPGGLKALGDLWNAPLKGYTFGDGSSALHILSYIASGVLGVIAVCAASWILVKLLAKRER